MDQLLLDHRGGWPESSLSLRSNGGGTPPLFIPVDCSDWVYAYAFRLDVKRDVSVAPGGVISLTSNLPPSIYCYVDYASGAPGLGLA